MPRGHGGYVWRGLVTVAAMVVLLATAAAPAGAAQTTDATPFPVLVHDVKTGFYPFGNTAGFVPGHWPIWKRRPPSTGL